MYVPYRVLVALMAMSLGAAVGCSSSDDVGTGGTGGTAGTGGTGGSAGTGGGGGSACPPAPAAAAVSMACRNSFNQVVSVFEVDLDVALDDCPVVDETFNASVTPTLTLDTTFLNAAAATLCDLGNALTEVDITTAQVEVDAVMGATCTAQLSVLDPVPQTIMLDATVEGECGAGGSVTINSGVSVSLPEVTVPCTGSAPGPAAFCSTGTTPLMVQAPVPAPNPPADSGYVSVEALGIPVAFTCGGPATTSPAPGNSVECMEPNPDGPCDDDVGAANFGEEPFETSDCDFSDGFPGTCESVPVAVDPTDCVTFDVEGGMGGMGGMGGQGGQAGQGGQGGQAGQGGQGGQAGQGGQGGQGGQAGQGGQGGGGTM